MKSTDQQWLSELNPRQIEAVTHGDGPLLVVAGAGSGKTRTLAYRVAFLVGNGIDPERILLLSFTRRAAQEMLQRAASAIFSGTAVIARTWGGTFHAAANRLLRMYASAAGLSPEFTILDEADAEDMLNVIRHDLGFASTEQRFPRKSTCRAIYSRRMNGIEDLDAVLKKYYPWCARWKKELVELFREYVERKQKHSILDYDDLLHCWYHLVQDPKLAESIGGRFDHILVDEYQDTNRVQAGILQGMRRHGGSIMAVGDDAQSIYSFRSATVRNMLDFPSQFPGTTVVTLDRNYRSVETIMQTTNRIIAQASNRFSKELWSTRVGGQRPQLITCTDERHEDETVIRLVLEHYEQGIPLRSQAVLFRAAWHSMSLELALTQRNIPFRKYGGLRFLEAAHIKDLICMLRILENPQDQPAWFRVLQLISGIGPKTAAAAFGRVAAAGYNPAAIADFTPPPAARQEMQCFVEMLQDLITMGEHEPAAQIERIRHFYFPLLKRLYENPEVRANDLEHLVQIADRYPSRKQFLTELVLDPPSSTGDLAGPPSQDEDWLVLSTIHSAKGCEWDSVYLIHAADGCLPSDMAAGSNEELEEELRLTYVAMTRARDFLYILWPLRFYRHGYRFTDIHTYSQCSRFFTPEVLRTVDRIGAGAMEVARDTLVEGEPVQDISGRMKNMWR